MQSDNLDAFEKLVFSIPSTSKLIAVNFIASLIYGSLTYFAIESFTGVELDIFSGISLILFIYLIPALIGAEILKTFISQFRRNWSLLLSLANQSILLLFSLIVAAADSVASAWSIL